MNDQLHECEEYRDANLALGTKSLAELCTAVVKQAKFVMDVACPTTGVVGVCGTSMDTVFYYKGASMLDVSEHDCKSSGGKYERR